MTLRAIRRMCRGLLADLDLPANASLCDIAGVIAARRDRPLLVQDWGPMSGMCGAWLASSKRDYIFVDVTASGLRRNNIIAHELGHLALNHDHGTNVLGPELAAIAFSDVDFASVRVNLERGNYSVLEERQAEVLAGIFLQEFVLAAVPVDTDRSDVLHNAFGS